MTDLSIYRASAALGIARTGAGYLIITSFNSVFHLNGREVNRLFTVRDPCRCATDIETSDSGSSIAIVILDMNKMMK